MVPPLFFYSPLNCAWKSATSFGSREICCNAPVHSVALIVPSTISSIIFLLFFLPIQTVWASGEKLFEITTTLN